MTKSPAGRSGRELSVVVLRVLAETARGLCLSGIVRRALPGSRACRRFASGMLAVGDDEIRRLCWRVVDAMPPDMLTAGEELGLVVVLHVVERHDNADLTRGTASVSG